MGKQARLVRMEFMRLSYAPRRSRNDGYLPGNTLGSSTTRTLSHAGLGNTPRDSVERNSVLTPMVSYALPRMQWTLAGAKRLECGSFLPLSFYARTTCLSQYRVIRKTLFAYSAFFVVTTNQTIGRSFPNPRGSMTLFRPARKSHRLTRPRHPKIHSDGSSGRVGLGGDCPNREIHQTHENAAGIGRAFSP
ncbi:MAG: hypothetical protein GX456_16905 [Verrucomicrobia bacterium]|nr:hypothetical protein [Verrucomicrobiota bacterium]